MSEVPALLAGRKVFILDASNMIRTMLASELRQLGATVEIDSEGQTALMRIIRWHPDILITGTEVGLISGFDLCLLLRLIPNYAGMPIAVISSGDDTTAHRAAEAGGDFYIQKDDRLITHAVNAVVRALTHKREMTSPTHPIRRVLVVDDSSMMRRIIRNILESIGVNDIIEAQDGRVALEVLDRDKVDLVLTDWNMPRMSGIDLVRAIRSVPALADLPVIMVTTESGQLEIEEARTAGASGHLCKPFSPDRLSEAVSRASALQRVPTKGGTSSG